MLDLSKAPANTSGDSLYIMEKKIFMIHQHVTDLLNYIKDVASTIDVNRSVHKGDVFELNAKAE